MLLPQIKTERLLLRMYRPEELETVYQLCSDPDVTRYFPDYYTVDKDHILTSLPRRLARWRQQNFGQLGIFDKTNGNLLGYCGLQYLDNTEEVEIYYGLFKSAWGKGLATEAAMAMLRFGFEQVKLKRIVAVTNPENLVSHKVLLKMGLAQGENSFFYKVPACYFWISGADYQCGASVYELEFEEYELDGH